MSNQAPATDNPEFCALVMNTLLFKLGGQYTLSLLEIAQVTADYPSVRVAYNIATSDFTLTLLTKHAAPEGGSYGEER
jgi:hypothetical protein